MINVILCGGAGTRLWPLSRTMMPKQFVRMFDAESLFQKTVNRNLSVANKLMMVANQEHYFLALDQLANTQALQAQFLLEAKGRNTAPAIALACMAVAKEEVMLITTSDHMVHLQDNYIAAVKRAEALALEGNLVTFGVEPAYPETGYGYIEADGENVRSFKEKPNKATAQTYIEQGNYLWNSGMFCFKAGVFLEELAKHAPDIFHACEKVAAQLDMTQARVDFTETMMDYIPEDSIDYAVLEKSKKVKVVSCDLGWSDLGSFDSLYEELQQEGRDNTVIPRWKTSPDPICVDSKDNFIMSRERQIALVDVDNLMVVDTADAILIANKNSSQKVKQVVAEVKKQNPVLADYHQLTYRPWGFYEVLSDADKYKVKRITVKPGGRLSMQKHFHRNEHWVVVSGTATVTVEDKKFLVRPNESTYIKMGEFHRLENDGKINLVMVEVQVGEYTGEDDIVRTEDVYARA